jgi:hypothetical protein
MAKEAQTAARKLRIFQLPVTEGPIDAPSIENQSPVVRRYVPEFERHWALGRGFICSVLWCNLRSAILCGDPDQGVLIR